VNVTGISKTANPYQNGVQGGVKQLVQDFQALDSAFQSKDLSSAQQAFAAVQQDLQKTTQGGQLARAFGQTPQLSKDFRALQGALQSNDLAGATQAFATLQQDMQGARAGQAPRQHKNVERGNDDDGDDGVEFGSSTSAVRLDQLA
jgi:hypothetical protein